jgi:hypothetical protein
MQFEANLVEDQNLNASKKKKKKKKKATNKKDDEYEGKNDIAGGPGMTSTNNNVNYDEE